MHISLAARRSCQSLFLVAMLMLCSGCGYTLRGKVVRGESASIEFIHDIDQRLKDPGVDHVEVLVHRDPQTPNKHRVGADYTNPDGSFSMTLNEFGSGWMDEQWLVQAIKPGYQPTETLMKLPAKGSKWQILITIAVGPVAPAVQSDDFMQDYEKFK